MHTVLAVLSGCRSLVAWHTAAGLHTAEVHPHTVGRRFAGMGVLAAQGHVAAAEGSSPVCPMMVQGLRSSPVH